MSKSANVEAHVQDEVVVVNTIKNHQGRIVLLDDDDIIPVFFSLLFLVSYSLCSIN